MKSGSGSHPYVLAIDQGTTSSRALVFDGAGRVVASAQKEFPQYYPKPGWVEHDAEEIWDSVVWALRQVLRKVPVEEVVAVGITNQRETTVLWSRATGKPVARAVVWQSRQSVDVCDALKKRGMERRFTRLTGLRLDPYFSGTKIRHLLDRGRGLERRARAGELAFGTIDTWLLWRLTGGTVHGTDRTNASRTLLMDLEKGVWSPWALSALGLDGSLLPEILPSSGILGHTEAQWTGGRSLPIAGMAGDQQAALFGQGCHLPGMTKNTYGTGCFLLQHTGPKPVFAPGGLLTTAACGAEGEPAFALEGSVFVGGSAIQWLRDGLGFFKEAKASEALAASVPDNGGVMAVPAFTGLGSPYWDPKARGSLLGLTRGTTRAHIARAMLESIAHQSADILTLMESGSGLKLPVLRVDGGATANALLMQTQADLSQVVVERPRIVESTAFGAAALAGLATGFWKDMKSLGKALEPVTRWKPRMAPEATAEARARWNRAVAATRAF